MNANTIAAAVAVSASLCLSTGASAAQTWAGKISDSSCGTSHDTMTEHGAKMSDKQCALGCVKMGAKYVLVSGDKVLKIANQDFKGLQQFAGDAVALTGDLKADTITVTKIQKAK